MLNLINKAPLSVPPCLLSASPRSREVGKEKRPRNGQSEMCPEGSFVRCREYHRTRKQVESLCLAGLGYLRPWLSLVCIDGQLLDLDHNGFPPIPALFPPFV